ncbi:hypothetical protein [Desulfocastanea catecholica]
MPFQKTGQFDLSLYPIVISVFILRNNTPSCCALQSATEPGLNKLQNATTVAPCNLEGCSEVKIAFLPDMVQNNPEMHALGSPRTDEDGNHVFQKQFEK